MTMLIKLSSHLQKICLSWSLITISPLTVESASSFSFCDAGYSAFFLLDIVLSAHGFYHRIKCLFLLFPPDTSFRIAIALSMNFYIRFFSNSLCHFLQYSPAYRICQNQCVEWRWARLFPSIFHHQHVIGRHYITARTHCFYSMSGMGSDYLWSLVAILLLFSHIWLQNFWKLSIPSFAYHFLWSLKLHKSHSWRLCC